MATSNTLSAMNLRSFFQQHQFTFVAIVFFLLLSFAYFSPILEGKRIRQSDVEQLRGATSEVIAYKEKTGKGPLWTNAMFGGMPTYQLWIEYPSNVAAKLLRVYDKILPNPINTVFLYLIGFFILLRVLKINIWLSIIGAIAFSFSSYNFLIIEAGHTNKALVIGLFAPTVAGVLLAYRGKLWQGGALTALFLAIQIKANHYQMSYYLAIAISIYIIIQFIYSIKEKQLLTFLKSSFVLLIAVIIAVGVNITPLWLTKEYADESIRGKSELRLDPNASTTGLSKEYAFEYSHGVSEIFTLLIPNFYGGSSGGELSKNSETYEFLKNRGVPNANQVIKQLPLYWGDQSFTTGPTYFGIIILFLFILGLFLLKGKEKWWILTTVILTIMLSWGKNFMALSEVFFNYFPYYNKFRAVSSILSVTSLLFPLMAILTLKEITEGTIDQQRLLKSLRTTTITVGGILLVFVIFPSIAGNFTNEEKDKAIFGEAYQSIISALSSDRASLLRTDALRSLAFILLSAGVIYFFIKKKLNTGYFITALGILILIDMWSLDKRYLNNEDFVRKSKSKNTEIQPTNADLQIMQDPDLYYRVYNTTVNPFTNASTSQFHKSIGGYFAAKMKRYQELIEHQITKGNIHVLNMLNTKYFIVTPQEGAQPIAQLNPNACGNAWFIKEIKYVANADSEMVALTNFSPAKTVIIDKRFKSQVGNITFNPTDSISSIKLIYYSPDTLKYESNTIKENFAVFSDIYYDKGWNAYVDGQKSNYIRVNYLLRGMRVPSGKHIIEFRFEPVHYYIGEKISFISSIGLVLFIIIPVIISIKQQKSINKT